MSFRPSLVVFAAVAGALISIGMAPAKAAEPGASETCRAVAPRYQPKSRSAQAEVVRFPGGARLHRPVAAPCPPSRRPVEV